MSKAQNCRNCGFLGHVYRDCPHPITSFGIICYRREQHVESTHGIGKNKGKGKGKSKAKDDIIKYLMIQRKDSLSFMEFIRGKYNTTDEPYVKKLLSGMTNHERSLIMCSPFEQLWNHVWFQPSTRLTMEYEAAKAKFDSLNGSMSDFLSESTSPFLEPEWGFPKGRRRLKENDLVCAIREFAEETGFSENDIAIHSEIAPFEEVFYGTNNILYRHVYYLASMLNPDTSDPEVNPNNINQAREVQAIRWFDCEETLCHIREHNKERRDLFDSVHKYVTTHKMILKMELEST